MQKHSWNSTNTAVICGTDNRRHPKGLWFLPFITGQQKTVGFLPFTYKGKEYRASSHITQARVTCWLAAGLRSHKATVKHPSDAWNFFPGPLG